MNTPDATWSGPNRLRTSDAEREEIATILRAAMTEGRLSLQEGEDRLGACYAATYRDDLTPLTADLPDHGRAALARTPEALATTRRLRNDHLRFVIMVSAVLTGVWLLSGAPFFWPIFPIFFLVMSLKNRGPHGPHAGRHPYPHRVAPWNAPPGQ